MTRAEIHRRIAHGLSALQRDQAAAAAALARAGATCRGAAAQVGRSVAIVQEWLRDPQFRRLVDSARRRQSDVPAA